MLEFLQEAVGKAREAEEKCKDMQTNCESAWSVLLTLSQHHDVVSNPALSDLFHHYMSLSLHDNPLATKFLQVCICDSYIGVHDPFLPRRQRRILKYLNIWTMPSLTSSRFAASSLSSRVRVVHSVSHSAVVGLATIRNSCGGGARQSERDRDQKKSG